MKEKLAMLRKERGVTALETAIILIAFVVVASVFAFTILSAGTTSTQKAQQAIIAGLAEVEGSMEVRGSVIALSDGTDVDDLTFSLANVTGGEPVDLSTGTSFSNTLVIEYRDATTRQTDLAWTVEWLGYNDGDDLLEDRELAQISIDLDSASISLGVNTSFVIEVKPPAGGVLGIERTTPARIDSVMDLG